MEVLLRKSLDFPQPGHTWRATAATHPEVDHRGGRASAPGPVEFGDSPFLCLITGG